MAAEMTFEWDSRELDVFRGGKVEQALSRALRMAGNKALREMQDASSKHVTSRKLIDEGRVRDGMPLVFPGRKDAIASLQWEEKVSGEAQPLTRFPFIATGQGVHVRVNMASGFKLLPSAFVRRMKSGHLGIFQRKGEQRLPIKELWTTRISDAMSDAGAADQAQEKAMAKFGPAFERGLARELEKLKRKGDL